MKRRGFKLFACMLSASMVCLALTACGGAKKADGMVMEENGTGSAGNYKGGLEIEDTVSTADKTTDLRKDRKIIENIELSVETREFDVLVENLNKQILKLGGYIESSNVSGREFDSDDNRSANMTIRIPAAESQNFSNYISENSVVINRSVTTEDVTLTYVDIESRVAALTAEKESLEALLKNAKSVEEIVTVRDKLTEVIYEIESYESQLRTYDNLVDYCTVTIYINEVERTTVVKKQGVWQEIGTNLKNNFANVWEGIVAFFIFAVSAIPYFIPFIIIAVIIVVPIVIRRKKKQRKEKTDDEH